MKIEQLLVQHFYNSRKVTLQGMGTFTLSPDFVMPKESDKDVELPSNAISFQYNARATEDAALIDFIVTQTRKMRALAAADLDSYLVLGKQFLNIGKPFKMEGIGMLVKNQQGDLEFRTGTSFFTKLDTIPADIKEKQEEVITFNSNINPVPNAGRKALMIGSIIVILGLAGTSAWYFLMRDKNRTNQIATVVPPAVITAPDSSQIQTDTVAVQPAEVIKPNDGYTFKVVFMITSDSNAAVAKMNNLKSRGHQVIMYKKDSTTFKLAEPFKLPLSDTTHVKDSLNNFYFLGKGFIEL